MKPKQNVLFIGFALSPLFIILLLLPSKYIDYPKAADSELVSALRDKEISTFEYAPGSEEPGQYYQHVMTQ